MKKVTIQNPRLLFYLFWMVLALVQASLTELQDDEAYYWLYGQYLDWGYFDHPPMIGLLVKLGYSILPNTLGVRLFPLVLHFFSLLLIEKLIDKKQPLVYFSILLSLAVLQISGFVAVPDIPLIFFTALFFYCYKRFVENTGLIQSLILGLSIALLFYSKYHAILVVLFAILSNPRLFLKWHIYVAGVFAFLLFLPHLYWQYQHDWVSFRYHLFESNVNDYRFSFTSEYILGQILLAGPIAGFILIPSAIRYISKSTLEKALKSTLIGLYVFFLLSSFRGKVEANWTSPALVPLIVLAHNFLLDNDSWRKWLFRLLPVTLILVTFARVVMITDILPAKQIRERYHSWKQWPKELKARTAGGSAVFSNSYQRASKYWFYSGQMTYSQNWYRERRNNFNFWPIEDSMLGKPAYFMDIYQTDRFSDSIQTPLGILGYQYDSAFVSFAKIQFQPGDKKIQLKKNDSLVMDGKVIIPDHYKNYLLSHQVTNDTIRIGIFNKKGWIKDIETKLRINDLVGDGSFNIVAPLNMESGKYFLRFTIKSGWYNPTHNSDKINLLLD